MTFIDKNTNIYAGLSVAREQVLPVKLMHLIDLSLPCDNYKIQDILLLQMFSYFTKVNVRYVKFKRLTFKFIKMDKQGELRIEILIL